MNRDGFDADEFDDDQAANLADRATERVFDGGCTPGVKRNGWLRDGEQSAALDQFLSANPISEEAEVTDADQAGRQHVEQKAADELDRI